MKPTHTILLGLVAASAALMAGSVTIPHSFTANTTAKASEVNENFSAVKTAVDGNAGDIATNKSDISDNISRITTNENNISNNANAIARNKGVILDNQDDITDNANNIAGMISGITAGGGLTGGGTSGDVTIKRASGSVAISAVAFRPADESAGCSMTYTALFAYFNDTSTNDNCKAYAPVSLPDGAHLDEIRCYVYNNDSASPTITLYMMANNKTDNAQYAFYSMTSSGKSDSIQTLSDDTANPVALAEVRNNMHSYFMYYSPHNTSSADDSRKLRGCTIDYSF